MEIVTDQIRVIDKVSLTKYCFLIDIIECVCIIMLLPR